MKWVLSGVFVVLVATLCLTALYPASTSAATGIESELAFQGKIVTSAGLNIPDGTYNMEFRIYSGCTNEPTSSTGCAAVWTEDYLNNNTQGVSFTSGTYQVNLGSICTFAGSTCENNTNSAVNWNSYPLYLSLQIGNTSNCSTNNPGSAAFTADCGGDGAMNPYILLTSTPYAENAGELGGIAASGFVQTAPTVAQTIQAAGNTTGLVVEQNAGGTYSADIFDVQGTGGSSDNFLQVSSSAANTGNVAIAGLGSSSTVGIQAGTGGTVSIGTTNANTVNIGPVGTTAVTSTVNIATSTGAVETVNIGSTDGSSTTSVQGGTGGVSLSTGAGSGTTGSISITSGSSSGGSSGNITIDTGSAVIGGTTVIDDTFEGTGSGSMNDWGTSGADEWFGATETYSNAAAHSGSYSLKVSETGSWGAEENYNSVSVTAGQEYSVSLWLRAGTVGETIDGDFNWNTGAPLVLTTITDTTTGWTQMTGTGVAPAGATAAYLNFGDGSGVSGQIQYMDDYVVTDNSTVSAPYLDLGATNAEAITLGNLNAAGATTIQSGGGGINIDAGTNATIGIGTTTAADNVIIGNTTGGVTEFQGNGITNTITGASSNPSDVIKTSTNSTAALQIQNASGYTILGVDTTHGYAIVGTSSRVNGGILFDNSTNTNTVELESGATSGTYTLALPAAGVNGSDCLQSTSGSTTSVTALTFGSCSGGSYINSGTSAQSANFYVQAATSGSVAGVIEANAAGTGDILDLENGSGVKVVTASSTGNLLVEPSTNSAAALVVENSTASPVLSVSTASGGAVTATNTASTSSPTITTQTSGWEWDNYNGTGAYNTLSTVSPHAIGDLMMLTAYEGGDTITSITGGGVSNWRVVMSNGIWEGTVTSTGTSPLTVTETGSTPTFGEMVAQEFSSAYGANTVWNVVGTNTQYNASTTAVTFPSLTTSQAGQLYWGYAGISSNYASGGTCNTTGFTCKATAAGDFMTWNGATAANTLYAPTATIPSSSGGSNTSAVLISAAPASGIALNVSGSSLLTASSTTAFQIQNNAGSPLFTADTTDGCINVGATNCVTSGSGGASLSAISTGISGNGLYGEDDQLDGNGVEGFSTNGSGLYGDSTNGSGLYAWSTNGIGLESQSAGGVSGLFQSGSSGNTATTLVAQQSGSSTANLFQAQNSSGASLFSIGSSGNIVLGPDGTTQNITVRGGDATGTNLNGGNITFQASNGTGSGGSGSLIFQTAAPIGSTVQTDNSADAGTFTGTSASPLTLSYTTGAEPNRFMVAQINSGCGNSVVSMTYDGISLTQLASDNTPSVDNTGCNAHTEVWDLVAPPSGTYNLVVTYAGNEGTVGVSTFYNVNQTTPIGTIATASGSTSGTQTTSLNVTASNTSQLVYDAIATDEGCQMGAPSSGQTQLWQWNSCSGLYAGASSSKPGASGTVNMGWQTTTSDWTDIGFAINPTTNATADGLSNSLVIANNGAATFENAANSTGALDVLNAAGSFSVFDVDTTDDNVYIGTATDTNTTPALLVLNNYDTFADPTSPTTCTSSSDLGGLYYNDVSDSVRACINGTWRDLISSQGLGLAAFGVVANSGTAANDGDYPSLMTAGVDGPCKVSWASATTVTVAPCVAYSGGRQINVNSTTLTLTTTTGDPWENVCLTGTNGQPAMVGGGSGAAQSTAAIFPAWSAASPVLCLATIKNSSGTSGSFTGGTAGMLYDIRTYTDTSKAYTNVVTGSMGLGYLAEVDQYGVQPSPATSGTANIEGIIVAYSGSTSSSSPDAIMATSGPADVVANSGLSTGTDYIETGTTIGYAITTTTAPTGTNNIVLGYSRTTTATGCTSAATCIGSLSLNLSPTY